MLKQKLIIAAITATSILTWSTAGSAQTGLLKTAQTKSKPIPTLQASTRLGSNSIVLRSRSADEAFTEPIETVSVASGESGIVSEVLPKRGDVVSKEQLLVELDQSILEAMLRVAQAKANTTARLKASEVELRVKSKRLNKLVELKADGAGSQEEVDKATADTEVARQNVAAIMEETEQFRLEMKQIEAQIEKRRIRSPIDGVVTDVKHKVGEFISVNDPHVITIVQLDTLRTVFHLPTARAKKIRQGDAVDILLTDSNVTASGIVEYVAPITRAASGRVRVDVLIDNPEQKYQSGVRCRIIHGSERTSMMSPDYR